MTRKLTLFLVFAFEIALILFVAAWSASANTHTMVFGKQAGEIIIKGKTIQMRVTNTQFEYSVIYKNELCFSNLIDYKPNATVTSPDANQCFASRMPSLTP
jgi:hypothetical protein